MGTFTSEIRKIQTIVFDRFMRYSADPDEPRLLAQVSKQITKDRRVVIVDSDMAYGNARALALDLASELSHKELLFIPYDEIGLAWAKSHGLNATLFSIKSAPNAAVLWDSLLRAKVSVYDTHNWWRTRDQLIQRSLLEGSFKVQLWHGATGPVGKVFGLERLNTAPTFWHFSAVATSSVGFDVLVNEPSQAEYRRTKSLIAQKSVHDVEYRLVGELNNGRWSPQVPSRILLAPTYPESIAGEDVLIDWMSKAVSIAKAHGWQIDVALHPGSKPRVAKMVKRKTGISPRVTATPTSELKNYRAVVTDFSGIAHDSLMCGITTVSVLIDLENYQTLCPTLVDKAQIEIAYVVDDLNTFEESLITAVESDPLASARNSYVQSVLSQLGEKPGVNTKAAILAALNT